MNEPADEKGDQDVAAIARAEFPGLSRTCFDGARWHPLPQVAAAAIARHAAYRAADGDWGVDWGSRAQGAAAAAFARVIGASPEDVVLVPSTTIAEQWVVRALDLPASGAIVTDLMHFDASVRFYDALAEDGADVRVVRPAGGRIRLEDVADALEGGGVRLVAVAAVSNATGFAHDLAALAALAHAHGALVYVDAIQAVGAIPFDVGSSGVDFCAASGYKWLMGDMGLGFLYVRPGLAAALRRPIHGFRQIAVDIEPWPPSGPRVWRMAEGIEGLFATASLAVTAAVSLEASIGLIERIGVDRIAAHRAPLVDRLGEGLSRAGHRRITPEGSPAPFVVFDTARIDDASRRLRDANIHVTMIGTMLRVAVSVFNTRDEVERLIATLS